MHLCTHTQPHSQAERESVFHQFESILDSVIAVPVGGGGYAGYVETHQSENKRRHAG